MELDEAIQILADWAICSAITQYSCDSCSRHAEGDTGDLCKNAVTEEQVEEALDTLIGRA